MKHLVEVAKLDEERWELYVDGCQTGQYPTLEAGKAAAKRRLPAHTKRLKWEELTDTRWVAEGGFE